MSLHAGQGSNLTAGSGLPGGSSGTLQYNANGVFGGAAGGTTDGTNFSLSGTLAESVAGTASLPAVLVNGAWYTGGSATTNKPQVLVEPAGVTSTGWSTSGTGLGVNATSAFVGLLMDLQLSGTSKFRVDSAGIAYPAAIEAYTGASYFAAKNGSSSYGIVAYGNQNKMVLSSSYTISWSSTSDAVGAADATILRAAAATLQLGAVNTAVPVSQTLQAQGSRPGTDTNVAGANFTVVAGLGTGTGSPSSLLLQSPVTTATGSGVQLASTGLTIKAGAAVLRSYTVTTLPSASVVGAGGMAFLTDSQTTIILALGLAATGGGGGSNKVPVYSDGTSWIIG